MRTGLTYDVLLEVMGAGQLGAEALLAVERGGEGGRKRGRKEERRGRKEKPEREGGKKGGKDRRKEGRRERGREGEGKADKERVRVCVSVPYLPEYPHLHPASD